MIMKILKNILLSLISAVITVTVLYGGYTIYAENNRVTNFRERGLNFREVELRYNEAMNIYFNEKIKILNELLEEEDFYDHEYFKVPADIDPFNDDMDEILEKCGKENVSTYCVSMGALKNYIDYVRILTGKFGQLELPETEGFVTSAEILDKAVVRNEQMREEIENARKVMLTTVSVYNEYKLAYPMHKKYREIIILLSKYRNTMRKVAANSSYFPVKFVNVTSSHCE